MLHSSVEAQGTRLDGGWRGTFMNRLVAVSDMVAAVALVFMLAVVSGSILTRMVFDLTSGGINLIFPGGIEGASYALLIAVFASFPRAAKDGLVSVELFTDGLPPRVLDVLDRVWSLLLAAFGGLVAYRTWFAVIETFHRGDSTQDLQIPIFWFYGYVVVATVVLTVVALWIVLRGRGPSPTSGEIAQGGYE